MSSVEWTPDRIKTLIAFWEEGHPTSEIGRRLGVTKNAVVGKVHRLGLKKRQSPIRQGGATPKPKAKVQPQIEAVRTDGPVAATPAPKAVKPTGDSVKMEELTSTMCCWPEGDPGTKDFHFCGKPSVSEKPYCEAHCQRAYVKVSKDRKKASRAA